MTKGIGTVVAVVLAIGLTGCKKPPPRPPNAEALDKVLATQDRVNRYLHKAVVPKMLSCWAGLQGKGTIAVQVTYRRDGELWAAGDGVTRSSTLATGQDDAALRCVQTAVSGTSFAVETPDADAKEFQVNWTFPVPWPKDAAEIARMIDGGGGGGCGGPEAPPPACQDCGEIPIIKITYCKKVCAGYTNCTPTPNGCNAGPIKPLCVTGSPFGNQGGLVLY